MGRRRERKTSCFGLRLPSTLSESDWSSLPNHGLFAIWDRPYRSNERPFRVVDGVEALRQVVVDLAQLGIGEIFVVTAASEDDLPGLDYQQIVEGIFRGIDTIKKSGDKETLLRIRAACESKGLKPGPKPNPDSNRWIIETLRKLAARQSLKQAVSQPKRTPQSASAQLSKFCYDFYDICRFLELHTGEAWQQGPADKWGKQQFGRFGFSFPKDLPAAEEAHRRGKESCEKLMAKAKYPGPGVLVKTIGPVSGL